MGVSKDLFDLAGKVAIVTGASGALGRAVSSSLAGRAVSLAICDLEEEALETMADEIFVKTGQAVLPIVCDVTDQKSVSQMTERVVAEFGKIDILFSAAGVAHREPLVQMAIEDWQRVMDINVKGTLLCCQAVALEMIKRGKGGVIITVGSVRGYHAHKDGYTAYGTSKAAIHYLTKQMAFEWAEFNIRVNGIAPCVFWSKLTEPILNDAESYQKYTSRIPLGRAAKPEDFVGTVNFLASDASEMVTGHMLPVDGGTTGG